METDIQAPVFALGDSAYTYDIKGDSVSVCRLYVVRIKYTIGHGYEYFVTADDGTRVTLPESCMYVTWQLALKAGMKRLREIHDDWEKLENELKNK